MALPVYNTTTSGFNSFGSSVTFAHTTTGTDKYLNVFVSVRSSAVTISSVTHNGNTLTLVTGSGINTGVTIAHYQMVNPDASGDVVVTLSGSFNVIVVANSYTGVNQSAPFGDVQTITDTAGTTSQITLSSASDELCIDGFCNRNGDTPSITGGQTLRGTVDSASQINASCSEEVGAASTVMSWSMATSGIRKSQSGYSIKGASAGGVSITAESGTYTYTGSSAGLLATRILQANSGSYNYTGTDINLLRGFTLSANSGSYAYSGANVDLIFTPVGSFTLTADTGTYSYSGTDINFSRNHVIIASSGTYTYSGSDISIILPGQIWTDKPNVSTSWLNQASVVTNWSDKTTVTTIWTDK